MTTSANSTQQDLTTLRPQHNGPMANTSTTAENANPKSTRSKSTPWPAQHCGNRQIYTIPTTFSRFGAVRPCRERACRERNSGAESFRLPLGASHHRTTPAQMHWGNQLQCRSTPSRHYGSLNTRFLVFPLVEKGNGLSGLTVDRQRSELVEHFFDVPHIWYRKKTTGVVYLTPSPEISLIIWRTIFPELPLF